ncbi:MAG: FAD:protein FMN transferase [Candidatus Hydrogenedentes bacterium]|nr:FAD:protein FMN transferase [Candidatus Hydrogenedentota bacterium]
MKHHQTFSRPMVLALAWSAILACAGCGPSGPAEHLFSGPTMGTEYHVKVIADLGPEAREKLDGLVADTLAGVNGLMSTYDPKSELSRFNQWASTDPFALSDETAEVFRIALEVSRQSGGAFDVTVGPLVNAFGFGPDESPQPPDDGTLASLRERVGYTMLTLDGTRISKARPDIYCDLSAVAKGYGVDVVANMLEAQGYGRYMVEVGGEVRAKGMNLRGQPWQIAVEKPIEDGRALQRIVSVEDQGLATSGDYRNFYTKDGQRYAHTIDPTTGRPVEHGIASASVLHKSCAWADAYATALMVLGAEKGIDLAREQGLAVLLISHTPEGGFAEVSTPAFDAVSVVPSQ